MANRGRAAGSRPRPSSSRLRSLQNCRAFKNKGYVGQAVLVLERRVSPGTLRQSLQIAERYQRAITIHCLKAWELLLQILRSERLPSRGFLLHAYSGPIELVEPLTEFGAYFSFSGYFLNPGKEHRLISFRQMRSDRLLAETDAPSMPLPETHSEFELPPALNGDPINHPGNILSVYSALAGLRKIGLPELMENCVENSNRLFGEV